MQKALFIAGCLAMTVVMAGCTSMSRGLGSITANKYADARSGTNWVIAPPELEPPALSDRVVYISYRNISDAELDLLEQLRAGARAQGWTITNDPSTAQYRLRSTLRFFGEVDPESGGMGVGRGLGTIAGAAVGAGTGLVVANALDAGGTGLYVGGAVGGVAGGLMAQGLSNASRPREWAYIIDFVLEEYSAQPISYQVSASSSSGRADVAGASNARMVSGGGQRSGNSSSRTITKQSNYFPHGVRLAAWANQMNMTQEEAQPELNTRIEKVVGQILPQ